MSRTEVGQRVQMQIHIREIPTAQSKQSDTGGRAGSQDEKPVVKKRLSEKENSSAQLSAVINQGEWPAPPKQDNLPQQAHKHPYAYAAVVEKPADGLPQQTAGDPPTYRDEAPKPPALLPAGPPNTCSDVQTKACVTVPANVGQASDPGPMFRLSPQPIFLVALAIAAALIIGYAALYLARRERSTLARTQREIGEALNAPGIQLSAVPAELRTFARQASQLIAKNEDLTQKNDALEKQLKQAELAPDARRAIAVSECLLDAANAAEGLAAVDPDFEIVDRALDLISGLRKAAHALKDLSREPSFAEQLNSLLERGEFDAPLTTSAILEKYYSERSSWREVRIGMRGADALLLSLLHRAGVQIFDVPILSIIESLDVRDMEVSDRRGLRSIPAIQQKAARIARELQPNELLVVDCHKPGWISDRFGSRAPHLAIFDPASWT